MHFHLKTSKIDYFSQLYDLIFFYTDKATWVKNLTSQPTVFVETGGGRFIKNVAFQKSSQKIIQRRQITRSWRLFNIMQFRILATNKAVVLYVEITHPWH